MAVERSNAITQQTLQLKSNFSFTAITEAPLPTLIIMNYSDSVLTCIVGTKSTQEERNVPQPT